MNPSFCPVCGEILTPDRFATGSAICKCGWTDEKQTVKNERAREIQLLITYSVFAVCFLFSYGHMVRWGAYAYSIPFLKVAQWTGTISSAGLETVIQACYATGRVECVEETHQELYQKTGNPVVLERLARFQVRRQKLPAALATLQTWSQTAAAPAATGPLTTTTKANKDAGSTDPVTNPSSIAQNDTYSQTATQFANLLEQANQTENAITWYTKAIETSQKRLPVRAMEGLLRLLMAQQKYEEARDHLIAFQKSSGNGADYFRSELDRLNDLLKKQPRKMAVR